MKARKLAAFVACMIAGAAWSQADDSPKLLTTVTSSPRNTDPGSELIPVRNDEDEETESLGKPSVSPDREIIPTSTAVDEEPQVTEPVTTAVLLGARVLSQTSLAQTPSATVTYDTANNGCQNCCCCDRGHGLTFFGEWLLLQPRGADSVFAVRALNCTTPPLETEQIDFGSFNGFKTGFAKTLHDGCSELVATYTFFESSEEERADRTIGLDIIRPVLAFDPLASCDNSTSTSAHASAGIDFDRFDIDYRSYFNCSCIRFDWLVGFGYGQLNQDLRAIYDESRVAVDCDLWGYGARFGGGATYGWGCLRAYTHADLTLLASNIKTHYRESDRGTGVVAVPVNFDQEQDRIVPVLDLEFGLAANLCKNTVLKVGYTYSIWFDVVTTPEFVESVQRHDITGTSDTLTFDGVFARVEFTW